MEYGFKIRAEFAHVKLITKALDILKSVSKGELTRCVSLLEEQFVLLSYQRSWG